MKQFKLSFLILLFFITGIPAQNKGYLFVIGGGDRPEYMMKRFIDLAGGNNSKIIIIPNASSDPVETAEYQVSNFKQLGCTTVDYLLADKHSADTDSIVRKLHNAKAIFFSGGDQNRLTGDLLNSKVLDRIKQIYREGGVIGGTSAGAAIMSKIMITGDELLNSDTTNAFSLIRDKNIKTAEGFGFIENAIIDQHFVARKRHNRLISLVLENPFLTGIGIDESTACIFNPDSTLEVLGNSLVIIYDASKSGTVTKDSNGNLAAGNILMSILKSGDKYNLKTQDVMSKK